MRTGGDDKSTARLAFSNVWHFVSIIEELNDIANSFDFMHVQLLKII